MTDRFRRHAILPPTSLPIELTMACIRTPAHVRHPRQTAPVSALWAPSPVSMDVTSADRACARYVVASADGVQVSAPVPTVAPVVTEVIDAGDYREPFTFGLGLGYAVIATSAISAVVMFGRLMLT